MNLFRHIRVWWRAFRSGAHVSSSVIVRGYSNIAIGNGCRIGRHVELNATCGGISLDAKCSIGPFSLIEARGGYVEIGCNTGIGPFCILYGHGDLLIGKDCLVASHVVFVPENHLFDRLDIPIKEQGGTRVGIKIEDDVWLATQVVVLDGVHIGKGAVVGAGSVVTHNIPAYAIAYGVPARVVGFRNKGM